MQIAAKTSNVDNATKIVQNKDNGVCLFLSLSVLNNWRYDHYCLLPQADAICCCILTVLMLVIVMTIILTLNTSADAFNSCNGETTFQDDNMMDCVCHKESH